MLGNTIAFIRV